MSEPKIDLHVTVTFDRPLTSDELQAFTDTIEVSIGKMHEAITKITVAGDYSVDGEIELSMVPKLRDAA